MVWGCPCQRMCLIDLLTEYYRHLFRLRRRCCIGCEYLPGKTWPQTFFLLLRRGWGGLLVGYKYILELKGLSSYSSGRHRCYVGAVWQEQAKSTKLDFFRPSSYTYHNFCIWLIDWLIDWMTCMTFEKQSLLTESAVSTFFSRMLGLPVDINTAVSDCIPIWYKDIGAVVKGQEIRRCLLAIAFVLFGRKMPF